MNLSQLYYFRKLAELQHYTKTAKELYITQPSLSDSIAALEKELEISLFQKKGRNVTLTKYGEEFYQYVSASLSELERGITLMKQKSGHISGHIDIGCIPTLLGDFLPRVIGNYSTLKNPLAKFDIYQDVSLAVVAGIKSGKYDIGFCSMVDNEPDLAFVPIISQELIAIVNTAHPLAHKKEIYLSDLRQHQLTTYRDTIPIGKTVRELLKKSNIEASFSYDDEITIGGVISKKPLVGIAANTPYLKQFDNMVLLKILDVPADTRLIYMVYSKKNFITSAVEAFADFVVATELNLPPDSK